MLLDLEQEGLTFSLFAWSNAEYRLSAWLLFCSALFFAWWPCARTMNVQQLCRALGITNSSVQQKAAEFYRRSGLRSNGVGIGKVRISLLD